MGRPRTAQLGVVAAQDLLLGGMARGGASPVPCSLRAGSSVDVREEAHRLVAQTPEQGQEHGRADDPGAENSQARTEPPDSAGSNSEAGQPQRDEGPGPRVRLAWHLGN